MNRRSNGTFKKRSRIRVLINWTLLLAILYVIIKTLVVTFSVQPDAGQSITTTSQTDVCMKDTRCKAKIENLAAQTLIQQEIDKTKAEYDAKLKNLEQRLEEKRKEELSLQ